jgi:RNA polymerase sigma factor (sigma-70 family)
MSARRKRSPYHPHYIADYLRRREEEHLSDADSRELIRAVRDGSPGARDRLICAWSPLILHVVHRWYPDARGDYRDDLLSAGMLGLLVGIDRANLEDPYPIKSNLCHCIASAVNRQRKASTWKWMKAVDYSWFEHVDAVASIDLADLESLASRASQEAIVLGAISELPEEDARLLYLRFGLGGETLPVGEIALLLGLDPARALVREAEIIADLRGRLAGGLDATDPRGKQLGTRVRKGRPPVPPHVTERILALWRESPDSSAAQIATQYRRIYGERLSRRTTHCYRPLRIAERTNEQRGIGRRISESDRALIRALWAEHPAASSGQICEFFRDRTGNSLAHKTARRYAPPSVSA